MKFITQFELYKGFLLAEKGLSENSWQAAFFDLQRLNTFLSDYNTLDINTSAKNLSDYIEMLYDLGFAVSSIQRNISTIRGYFSYLNVEGYINIDPSENLSAPKKPMTLPSVLLYEEVDAIFSVLNLDTPLSMRDKAMIELLYGCGLRVSECANLLLENIIDDVTFLRICGKGNKERFIPIGDMARDALLTYLIQGRPLLLKQNNDKNVFLNSRGVILSRMGLWKIVQKYVQLANVSKHVSPHTFRHTFATHLLEGGADLRVVQELLGHSSILTTEIYTHIDKTHLIETHRHFHPRSKI